MKKVLFAIAAVGFFLTSCEDSATTGAGNFKSEREKLAYSLGIDIARNVEKAKIDSLDVDALCNGLRDALNKKDLKLTDEECKKVISEYFNKQQQAQRAEKVAQGQKFLAENSKKSGVVTLASGLQYQVIKEGNGPKPTINDKVTVHYHGTLLDGKVFDSSIESGKPITFPVGGVITGWTEALQLMPVGSKWKLFIPSNLAYGEVGAGGIIGPNETLVFEVELISIDK